MRIRRGLLFAGLFFIPVGVMTLLVRAGTISAASLADVWRFWPLVLIGIGIALLLGRSRAASVGIAIAALVLGILVGSAIASNGDWIATFSQCGSTTADSERIDRNGAFTASATIDLKLRCGTATLTTGPGDAWGLQARYDGAPPTVDEAPDRLQVQVPDGSGVRRNDWTITAPTGRFTVLRVASNAATGSFTLAGATLQGVTVQANAGDILVDGADATIGDIDVDINAGRARVTLAGTTEGRLQVNAGAIDLCVPSDANLTFDVADQLTFVTNLADRGLQQNGTTWTRSGSGGSVTLRIDGNAASFTLDPDGGCR
jgi:hypothetical protein